MTTYIADIDLVGSEMERPFMRVYVNADDDAAARVEGQKVLDTGEVLRDVHRLQPILDDVSSRPSDWSISWKDEGREGPVVLTDKTKLPPAREDGAVVVGIPFGSAPEWEVMLPWMSRAEARRLARYLGLTLEVS